MMIKFTVPGVPVPTARARTVTLPNGVTSTYTPTPTVDYQERVKAAYLEAYGLNMAFERSAALVLHVYFYLPRPKSAPRSRYFPTVKPDTKNLLTGVEDALEGLAYLNDSQIVDDMAAKRYGDPPRTEVVIWELEVPLKRKEPAAGGAVKKQAGVAAAPLDAHVEDDDMGFSCCTECGYEIEPERDYCPRCGFPRDGGEVDVMV